MLERRAVGVAIAIFVCILITSMLVLSVEFFCCGFCFGLRFSVGRAISGCVGVASGSMVFCSDNARFDRKVAEGFRFSVFKGREARLNRAIFMILAVDGPKTVIELQKQLCKRRGLSGTYYASVNKRIHCLENAGYVASLSSEASEAGSKARRYALSTKAYLALFMSTKSPEDLLKQVTDRNAEILLSDMINAFFGEQ